MSSTAKTISDQVHALADGLPTNATWSDVLEQVRYRQAVEEGQDAAERGDFATEEEVRAVFARSGVKYAP